MSHIFDLLAYDYDLSLEGIPREYINLIQLQFGLEKSDRVLDLGCGSGLLTFPLAELSDNVQGVDSSLEMIRLAHNRDKAGIEWICSRVEDFDFGYENYKLIIAFESFHLFSKTEKLIDNIFCGLTKGGFFCVGWVHFHWEQRFKEIIIEVFDSYGVNWGNEANLARVDIYPLVIRKSSPSFSNVITKSITVKTRDYISKITSYLASIEKVASVDDRNRTQLKLDLQNRFQAVENSEWITGFDKYVINYSQKS